MTIEGGQPLHMDEPIDTFEDGPDGKWWAYASCRPERRYPVVELLDGDGETTDDHDDARGGVVQLGEASFACFFFGAPDAD